MKKGQLFILLVICLIVGSAGWLIKKKSLNSWQEQETAVGQLLFTDFPLNDVTKLIITSKEKTVEITKESDHWIVKSAYSYFADFTKIADILKTISELKMVQKIEIGKDDLGRLELNDPEKESETATKVEFFDKNNTLIGKLLLGKNHMRKSSGPGQFGGGGEYPDGRYLYEPKSGIVALVSETFSNISDDGNSWLDKTFFKVEKIKKGIVKEKDAILWEVHRDDENGSLKLAGNIGDDEELEQSKINGIDSALRYPSFVKIADASLSPEEHGFAEGRTYIAETFDGFTYSIDIGKKGEDENYPIRISIDYKDPSPPVPAEDESEEEKAKKEEEFNQKLIENKEKFEKESKRYPGWVYMVSSYTVDDLLLNRSELIKKREKDEESETDEEATNSAQTIVTENKNNLALEEEKNNNEPDLSDESQPINADAPATISIPEVDGSHSVEDGTTLKIEEGSHSVEDETTISISPDVDGAHSKDDEKKTENP